MEGNYVISPTVLNLEWEDSIASALASWIEESSVSVSMDEEVERWVIIRILMRASVYIWFSVDQEDPHHERHQPYLVQVQDVDIESYAVNISVQRSGKTLDMNQTFIVLSAGATVTQMFSIFSDHWLFHYLFWCVNFKTFDSFQRTYLSQNGVRMDLCQQQSCCLWEIRQADQGVYKEDWSWQDLAHRG